MAASPSVAYEALIGGGTEQGRVRGQALCNKLMRSGRESPGVVVAGHVARSMERMCIFPSGSLSWRRRTDVHAIPEYGTFSNSSKDACIRLHWAR